MLTTAHMTASSERVKRIVFLLFYHCNPHSSMSSKSTPISQLPRGPAVDSAPPGQAAAQPIVDDSDDVAIQDVLAEINKAHNPEARQMQSLPIKPVPSVAQQQLQLQMQLQQLQQAQQQQFHQHQQAQQHQMYPDMPQQVQAMPPQFQLQQHSQSQAPQQQQLLQTPSLGSLVSQLWDNYFQYIVLFVIVVGAVFIVNSAFADAFVSSHLEYRAPHLIMPSKAVLTALIVVLASAQSHPTSVQQRR